jgi:hypothetical protein
MTNCQISRLLSQVRTMQPLEERKNPVHLWIDTFGIPACRSGATNASAVSENMSSSEETKYQKLKMKAIRMMSVIYAGAEMVLALDGELQRYSTREMGVVDITARLYVCGWSTRAWTLQEGGLAAKLGYQFQDGVMFAKEGQILFNETLKIALWNRSFDEQVQVLNDCRQAWFLPSVGRHKPDRLHSLSARDVQFMEVWNSLLDKNTTHMEDFHEIVAK